MGSHHAQGLHKSCTSLAQVLHKAFTRLAAGPQTEGGVPTSQGPQTGDPKTPNSFAENFITFMQFNQAAFGLKLVFSLVCFKTLLKQQKWTLIFETVFSQIFILESRNLRSKSYEICSGVH